MIREEVSLSRDTEAVQIPDGTRVVVPEGTPVLITQSLGGSYTVLTQRGAMLRIDERNADALGKEAPPRDGEAEATNRTLEERVWAQMKKCFDPEIPVNIVDLGLVYGCRLEERAEGGTRVEVKMTLTAPGCGMGSILAQDVRQRIEELPGVAEADVEIVFDPPWNQNMMTEAAKLQLGFF